jgi:four helix bundle protein
MPTTSFMQLDVWRKAYEVNLAIYRMTERFPRHQLFGLTAQMQRAAVSIPANIAEGYGRRAPKDKARFYNIAAASSEELRYYLILSKDLGYQPGDDAVWLKLDQVCGMLRRLWEKTLSGV